MRQDHKKFVNEQALMHLKHASTKQLSIRKIIGRELTQLHADAPGDKDLATNMHKVDDALTRKLIEKGDWERMKPYHDEFVTSKWKRLQTEWKRLQTARPT
jgi:hypothetical protein